MGEPIVVEVSVVATTTVIEFVQGMETWGTPEFKAAEATYCDTWKASMGDEFGGCKVNSFTPATGGRRKRSTSPVTVDATITVKNPTENAAAVIMQKKPASVEVTKTPVVITTTAAPATTPMQDATGAQCPQNFKMVNGSCIKSGSITNGISIGLVLATLTMLF